jgi:uncharacterized membrane protein YczE
MWSLLLHIPLKWCSALCFLLLAICILNPASAVDLVSTRVRAALQTIALALKQEFGVNVHVIAPRTVSLYLLRGIQLRSSRFTETSGVPMQGHLFVFLPLQGRSTRM